ncbi:cytokine receptor-like [Toxorhynchites rutilus septentrionalis]|uniref:cytokine receptor-like n=1 Tax=Toxorhynchites rutilus septentrionalis TaxID=329112 RepID=UPI0024789731|nr:cytokine receptor-like [Toxorhynchites rutilus septentrionalis]XP_055630614.1 cytokine receptor-like [Toxorhynchites rutilus septentrionalis]
MLGERIPFFLILLISAYSVVGLGWISPQAPIYRLVNQSYNLSCSLNSSDPETKKFSSNDLMFFIKDVPVSREYITILNETTIQLNVQNATVSAVQYICKLNFTKGVDMRSVFVGYKPYNVTNFKCRSENWQKMNCSFGQEYNPIPTTYDLSFRFDTSPVDFNCPLEGQFNNTWKCSIDLDSSYRQSHELYYFVLVSNNSFGKNREVFEVNNFNNVIPEAPSECQANNITSNSAILHWTISYKLQTFKRDFIFQVKILSSFDNKSWKPVSTDAISKSVTNYTLPIENLEYADARYDVRVRMRTLTAENIEEMWSNYSSCLFNTLPRRPDEPPKTAIGGFEINVYNDIFVYWREIPRSKHNSVNGFRYKITDIRRNGIPISNVTEGRNGSTMVQFRNMTDGNYTFVIRSSNSEGDSLESSTLFIPSKDYRLPKPEIIKLLSDSGRYLLSWKANPEHASKITSYTIFWCNSSSNSPNDCNGSISFDYVNGTANSYELNNVSSTLNFAVAANSGKMSSGMVWASCTATQKNDIGKLKTIWIPAMQSTYIDLEWKLECGDSAIVEGYNIIYCPINSPRDQSCRTPEKSLNITGTTSHRISELKPYVTYKIQVAMYSRTRIGPRSEPLFNTTLEAAPSPPRDLICKEIRNDSITLQWKPPLHINGGKMNYEVWYNHLNTKVYIEDYTKAVTYTLTTLKPFTNYKIIVRAYTIGYSNTSNSVDVTTEIGVPGVIQQPGSVDLNDTRLAIQWSSPELKAGCIEYYELRIKTKESDTITRVQSPFCRLKRSICQIGSTEFNRTDKYEFYVRAVNVILSPHAPNYTIWNKLHCGEKYSYYIEQGVPDSNQHYTYYNSIECERNGNEIPFINWNSIDKFATILHGEWSKPLSHWCNYGPENTPAIIFLTIIACSGIVSLSICTYVSLKKMKQIKNIKVVLPDALNDIVASDKSNVSRDFNSFHGHDNYDELLVKAQDDRSLSFALNHRHTGNNLPALDDATSLSSSQENLNDGDGIINDVDLLSLSDDYKSHYNLSLDKGLDQTTQTKYNNSTDMTMAPNKDNLLHFNTSGYVLAPKHGSNGYVLAPMPKAPDSNVIRTNCLVGNGNTNSSKMPIMVSTDVEGISGYVTHKQLVDYGHKMQ